MQCDHVIKVIRSDIVLFHKEEKAVETISDAIPGDSRVKYKEVENTDIT